MKGRRLLFILSLCLLGGGLLLVRGGGDKGREGTPYPLASTYATYPQGGKALYLLLEKAKFLPSRHFSPFTRFLPEGDLFVAISPFMVREDEVTSFLSWIRKGNVAIWVTSWEDPLVRRLRIPLEDGTGERSAGLVTPSTSPYFQSVREVALKATKRIRGGTPILEDREGSVVSQLSLGKGTVLLCSSPWLWTNEGMREKDNVVFLVNLLALHSPSGRVVFDEYHHGFRQRSSLLLLLSGGWQIAFFQIVLGLCLVTFLYGKEHAPPLPLPLPRRRSLTEFIESMGSLLQKARAHGLVFQYLYLGFRRKALWRTGRKGSPPLLPRQLPGDLSQEEFQKFVMKCEERIGSKEKLSTVSEHELIWVSKQIERMERSLGSGRHAGKRGV